MYQVPLGNYRGTKSWDMGRETVYCEDLNRFIGEGNRFYFRGTGLKMQTVRFFNVTSLGIYR